MDEQKEPGPKIKASEYIVLAFAAIGILIFVSQFFA